MECLPLRDQLSRNALADEWPLWHHLESGEVVTDARVLDAIATRLTAFNHCLLTGKEGRGKTSLARYVAFTDSQVEHAYYVDLTEREGELLETLCATIQTLSAPLYVIENIQQLQPPQFRRLLTAALNTRSSRFLWTERTAGKDSLWDSVEFWVNGSPVTRNLVEVRIRPTSDLVGRIVDCHAQQDGRRIRPSQSDYEGIAEECGRNLRVLSAYMAAWQAGPFSSIKEDDVLRVVFRRRVGQLPERLRSFLISIAAIGQFDVPVWAPAISVDEVAQLADLRLLTWTQVANYCRVCHSTDSRMDVRAWAAVNGESAESVTRRHLTQYLAAPLPPRHRLQLLAKLSPEAKLRDAVVDDDLVFAALLADFQKALATASADSLNEYFYVVAAVDRRRARLVQIISSQEIGRLADLIRDSDAPSGMKFFNRLWAVNRTLALRVGRLLGDGDYVQMWLRTPVHQLARYWRESIRGAQTQRRRFEAVIERMSDGAGATSELMTTLSWRDLDQLLSVASQVNKPLAVHFADNIASKVDLTRDEDPGRATLLLKDMWACGNLRARSHLLARMIAEMPPARFAGEQSGRGAAFVLYGLRYEEQAGRPLPKGSKEFIAAMVKGLSGRVSGWDPISLHMFLFNLLLLDRTAGTQWIENVSVDALESVLLRADVFEAFWVVLNTAIANRSVGQQLGRRCATALRQQFLLSRPLTGERLPLLGLLTSLEALGGAFVLDEPAKTATVLLQAAEGSRLVFALRAYEAYGREMARPFMAAVCAGLRARDVADPFAFLGWHRLEDVQRDYRGTIAKYLD